MSDSEHQPKHAPIDPELLKILVCPVSRTGLHYEPQQHELLCLKSGLAYPIEDDIPVLLAADARQLSEEEILRLRERLGTEDGGEEHTADKPSGGKK